MVKQHLPVLVQPHWLAVGNGYKLRIGAQAPRHRNRDAGPLNGVGTFNTNEDQS